MFPEPKQTSQLETKTTFSVFFHHAGRGRIRMKRPLAFHQRTSSKLFTGWCSFTLQCSNVWWFGAWSQTRPPRSEEEMLKFMGLMNSSWVLDGHDIATAFNLSSFQNIVDLGGKRLNKQVNSKKVNDTRRLTETVPVVDTLNNSQAALVLWPVRWRRRIRPPQSRCLTSRRS